MNDSELQSRKPVLTLSFDRGTLLLQREGGQRKKNSFSEVVKRHD